METVVLNNREPRMKRLLSLLAVCLLVQGCASSLYVKMDRSDLPRVKGADRVTLVYTQTPPMVMDTPRDVLVASAQFRWANASAGYHEGDSLWNRASRHYRFPQPAPVLAKSVFEGLKREAGLQNLRFVEEPFDLYEAWGAPSDTVRPEYGKRFGNGYVLEVRPLAYLMNYLPHKWSTYALVFRSQALLVNLADNRVVWRGFCAAGGYDNDALRFDWKKMDDAEAARLKNGIALAARICAEQLVGQFQGKDTKP